MLNIEVDGSKRKGEVLPKRTSGQREKTEKFSFYDNRCSNILSDI